MTPRHRLTPCTPFSRRSLNRSPSSPASIACGSARSFRPSSTVLKPHWVRSLVRVSDRHRLHRGLNTPVCGLWSCRRRVEGGTQHRSRTTRRTLATMAAPDREGGGGGQFRWHHPWLRTLTTIAGGWWAARLQARSWARQNELRLREAEQERAAGACRELTSLLDRRLYRMLRLLSATRRGPDDALTPRNSSVDEANTTKCCMPGTTA